jgi:LmbE family N-acetylglucosaminyl deacetylase
MSYSVHDLGRLAIVSPHLDDAVFGCGELLAERTAAIVVTVFAGIPAEYRGSTPWDRACGFVTPQEAVRSRRAEDQEALDCLAARPIWLRFLDSQYAASPGVDAVAAELSRVLADAAAETVLVPLGLYHSDHELAHEACLLARASLPAERWIAYEDALYRRREGVLQRRLAHLLQRGIVATPVFFRTGASAKVDAIRCYRSQLRAFGSAALADTALPEGYWRLDDA